MEWIQKNKKVLIYVICGIGTTLVDWVTYWIFRQFHMPYVIANICSWLLAVLFAYGTNKQFVFQTPWNQEIGKEVLSFTVGRIGTGILQIAGITFLVSGIHLNEYIAKAGISVLVLILNYVISKKMVFRKQQWKLPIFSLLSFLIPIVMMTILFAIVSIYPLGENFFVKSDGFHQYVPFLKEFARKLQEGSSLFYTNNLDLGSNFLTLYGYYLASPWNWLLYFVPLDSIPEFASWMVVLKVGIASFSFYILCKTKWKRDSVLFFAGSFSYALSGWFAAYNWNIMWLDIFAIAPLVMAGILRLIRQKKIGLYLGSLTFCILSNYYLAIMICLFSVFYFILEWIQVRQGRKTRIKTFLLFVISSLFAGGFSAILLIPEFYGLMQSASAEIEIPTILSQYYAFLEFVPRHFFNLELSMTGDFPNLYAGTWIFLLLPIYFCNSHIPIKRRFLNGIFLVFLLLGFQWNILDFIWHGFHFPNSLPCRQSFLYIAFLLLLCVEGLLRMSQTSIKQIVKIDVGLFFLLMGIDWIQKIVPQEAYQFQEIWETMVCITVMFGCLLAWKRYPDYKKILQILFVVCVSLELMTNLVLTSLNTWDRKDYTKADQAYETLLDQRENPYARTEKRMEDYRTKNDGAWYDYESVSTFSSASNHLPSDFYKLMGLESSWNAANFRGATPFMSSFLGIQYELSDSTKNDGTVALPIRVEDGYYLYENKYPMSLGFEVSVDQADQSFQASYPADNQNKLSRLFTGEDVLIPIADSFMDHSFSTSIEDGGRYFVFIANTNVADVIVTIDDQEQTFENTDRGYLLDLGVLKEGSQITVQDANGMSPVQAVLYEFQWETVKNFYENSNGLTITEWKDGSLKGSIHMLRDDYLLLTIPYDEGWSVYVDGEKVSYEKLYDTFLGIPLSKGTHEIQLIYVSSGFYLGVFITGISILLFGTFVGIRMRMSCKKKEKSV